MNSGGIFLYKTKKTIVSQLTNIGILYIVKRRKLRSFYFPFRMNNLNEFWTFKAFFSLKKLKKCSFFLTFLRSGKDYGNFNPLSTKCN